MFYVQHLGKFKSSTNSVCVSPIIVPTTRGSTQCWTHSICVNPTRLCATFVLATFGPVHMLCMKHLGDPALLLQHVGQSTCWTHNLSGPSTCCAYNIWVNPHVVHTIFWSSVWVTSICCAYNVRVEPNDVCTPFVSIRMVYVQALVFNRVLIGFIRVLICFNRVLIRI